MKKTLIILGLILVVVFVALSLMDTSDYGLEKKLYRVQKQFNQVALDPKAIPNQKFESIADQYRALIKSYPDSKHAPKMYIQIGMVYLLKDDTGKALKAFEEVLTIYPDDTALGSVALMNIGNIYENGEDEKKAIQTYERIMKDYGLTSIGLNMPLYLANYYMRLDKKEKGEAMIVQAIAKYKDISAKYPKSPLEFNALRLLVTAYYAQNEWRQAVNTLGMLLLSYATGEYLNPQRAMLLVKSINTVSITKIHDYDLPRGIYNRFMDKYPKHPFNKVLVGMIEALDKLEEKGVAVSKKKP